MLLPEPATRHWRTDEFNGSEQYDAWAHLLNEAFGSWDVATHKEPDFFASVSMSAFDDFGVVKCKCDPCSGTRKSSQISRDDKEFLAIQLTLKGRENVRLGDQDFNLGPGDIMIWDSTKEMHFSVEESLQKVSLILPLQRLKSWMPLRWQKAARKIEANSANAILLTSYIDALANQNICDSRLKGEHLSEAAVALLAGTVDQKRRSSTTLRRIQLEQVKSYILSNLDDTELSLSEIARVNKISLRYLHLLFEENHETAARYLQTQRLKRCRRDLENPLMKSRKIGDIAQSWGFNDAMHFSRVFKKAFGITPSEARALTD
ncbi:MAG TPA: helix-turn-helix domain-containing protein [Xanthomonadales bacterium]|nr:helix-turn-helix domain-containing protein [Xanthomonadales bacterium]